MQYTTGYDEKLYTYVNSVNTREGGTHLEGFRSAITRAINVVAKRNGIIKENAQVTFEGEDVREGLTSVVSVKMANPQFEGQQDAPREQQRERHCRLACLRCTHRYFDENPNVLKIIIEKALSAAKAREAARNARELARRKSCSNPLVCPGSSRTVPSATPQRARSIS